MTDKKALEAAETIVAYCIDQRGCQNCIFRKFAPNNWKCEICAFELRNVLGNKEAKRKNGGWI